MCAIDDNISTLVVDARVISINLCSLKFDSTHRRCIGLSND